MSGISITVDLRSLDDAIAGLRAFLDVDREELLTTIGAVGESQTRRRIEDEKTAPDGTPWQPNRKGNPILVETGQHLLATIAFDLGGADTVAWGSWWEYAHVHQEGATIVPKNAKALAIPTPDGMRLAKKAVIPARPFLGLSDDNVDELLDIVTDAFGVLRGHP